MMTEKADRHKLRSICREVGVSHVAFNEVMRRIADRVINEDAQIITYGVGTFRRRLTNARVVSYKGVDYPKEAFFSVALRGVRSPAVGLDSDNPIE